MRKTLTSNKYVLPSSHGAGEAEASWVYLIASSVEHTQQFTCDWRVLDIFLGGILGL